MYLCVFFVPQHGVRRPVLSIFLPSIHSAVAAATIFSTATACMLHIRIFSNGSMYVGVRGKVIKRLSGRDFSESPASGLLPTHPQEK